MAAGPESTRTVAPATLAAAAGVAALVCSWPGPARADADVESPPPVEETAAPGETLSLADVLRTALDRAPMIRGAQARIDMARAMPDQVSAWPVPTVGVQAMGWPASPMDGWEIQYTVKQMFPLTDMLDRRREAAEAGVDAARADAESVPLDVVLEIRLAYVELARALAEREVVDDQEGTIRRMARVATTAYASGTGMGSTADTLRARAEIPMLADERAMMDAMAASARAMIAAAGNLDAHEVVADPAPLDVDAFEPPPMPALEYLLQAAADSRPEFAALEARARQAESNVLAAGDERVPDLMLEAGIQQRIGGDMAPVAFMVGAAISLPWLTPDRFSAMEAEARAQGRMVRSDADALGLAIESELRGLVARYEQAAAGIRSYRRIVGTLGSAERSAVAAYVSGTGDFDAILNLEARVLEARRTLVRYVFGTLAIRAQVDRVVARPVEEQILGAEVWP